MTCVVNSVSVHGEALLSGSDCDIVEPQCLVRPESVRRSAWKVKKT